MAASLQQQREREAVEKHLSHPAMLDRYLLLLSDITFGEKIITSLLIYFRRSPLDYAKHLRNPSFLSSLAGTELPLHPRTPSDEAETPQQQPTATSPPPAVNRDMEVGSDERDGDVTAGVDADGDDPIRPGGGETIGVDHDKDRADGGDNIAADVDDARAAEQEREMVTTWDYNGNSGGGGVKEEQGNSAKDQADIKREKFEH